MTKSTAQQLFPPEHAAHTNSTDPPGIFRWLIEPLEDRMLLPLAGLWILGLDWLLFPPEEATLMLATPVAAVVGFVLGGGGVYQMQRRFARDSRLHAALKALLAGIIVGLPFPLAGTVIGGWILATSGLIHLRDRLFRK